MKPFSDGEFVKDCLMAVVDVLIPEKRSLFSNISLSRRTVTRRIEELAEDLKISLRTLACKFELYSLAVDKSTDQTDIAQLAVYIRGIIPEFDIIEELANLVPLTGTDILRLSTLCWQALI